MNRSELRKVLHHSVSGAHPAKPISQQHQFEFLQHFSKTRKEVDWRNGWILGIAGLMIQKNQPNPSKLKVGHIKDTF